VKNFAADTGPLLHLEQAGLLDLLAGMGRVFTTSAVIDEWRRLGVSETPKWLTVKPVSANASAVAGSWIRSGLLHKGEAEVLAVACELKTDGFLTDDAAAREMASALGFEVRGSLGVVLGAASRGLLKAENAFAALDAMQSRSTLWLSARVRREAHAALRRILENQ
jgi:predicted nucleic acid-binding protein